MSKKSKKQRRKEWKRREPKVSGVSFYLGERIWNYMAYLDEDSLAIYDEVLKSSLLSMQPMIECIVAARGSFDSTVTIMAEQEANQILISYNGLVKHHDGKTYLAVVVDLQQEGAVGGVSRPTWLGNHKLPTYTSALEGLAQ